MSRLHRRIACHHADQRVPWHALADVARRSTRSSKSRADVTARLVHTSHLTHDGVIYIVVRFFGFTYWSSHAVISASA